jgi:glycylpeptide N-tetradecanoyltransferase
MFRFDYSKDFLKWHLTAPGYYKEWSCAVMKENKSGEKQMVGFISAIPVHIVIHGNEVSMVEINFLCVHSSFRNSRLAPVLIKEITRRVHLKDIWQAVYTAGVLLPKPIAKCTYYHRNLNIQKLLDVKFTYLSPHMNLARAKGIYKLAKEPSITGIRKMEEKDVDGVYKLLNGYLTQFKVRPYFSKEEIRHWFTPRSKVVYTFVLENYETGEITDMLSFYSLPSSVLNHEVHKTLFAAYSFFNVAITVTYKELIKNALILAKSEGFDVYNALNLMQNNSVFTDLLFGQGDGSLKYYLYNYKCPTTEPKDLALVLM